VVCIEETKLGTVANQQCFMLWGSNAVSWVRRSVDLDGGGIMTVWNHNVLMCERTEEGKKVVVIEGKYKTVRGDKNI